jgi:hypothetical protein
MGRESKLLVSSNGLTIPQQPGELCMKVATNGGKQSEQL